MASIFLRDIYVVAELDKAIEVLTRVFDSSDGELLVKKLLTKV